MMRKEKIEELDKLIEGYKTVSHTKINIGEGRFIKIGSANYTLANGKTICREEVIKNNDQSSAVIVLPVTKEQEIITCVQPRVLTKTGVNVELPAGYIDEGETGLEAAIRELKEETGYIANEIIKLTEFYYDQGCCRALNECFLALDCEKVGNQELDSDEMISLFKCTYEELLELMENKYINDGGSIITIEKSKSYFQGKKD